MVYRLPYWARGGVLLAALWLVGCGAISTPESTSNEAVSEAMTAENSAAPARQDQTAEVAADTSALPERQPQLVKQANMSLRLADVEAGIDAIYDLAVQQQGDILNLRDQQPDTGQPRQVSLRLRIPQSALEATLDALRQLGEVQQQQVTVTDVSNQLVDLQARLRNLRKSEETLLTLMERSGSVADVLQVAQELSNVRETIERLEAQRQQLNTQVTYATVQVQLEATVTPVPTNPPLAETLTNTWQQATHSVSDLSTGVLRLSLWLIAYSPYWALVLAAAWGYRRWQRQAQSSS
ncbi:hypothetical protein XM38_007780 [Halomicronema hongdechloris C2206]|uniref:DUF4349 domain-containing protein n=1 Tax=Halomicronema hongdechloris C2206 TaxID=1641165 RepID=A0A1Z3HHU4_9CYAN|nr:DUF4349 domain-containing protein [Halomicronema hongdechloris]ASC69848.1 hypothetical protein XM38_007780 [Halomicronema hongdechloris C2206]